jgi:hypothetical protein
MVHPIKTKARDELAGGFATFVGAVKARLAAAAQKDPT